MYGYNRENLITFISRRRKIAIQDTIVSHGLIKFCDVVGLNDAKQALKEAVVTPLQFPHFFTGKNLLISMSLICKLHNQSRAN